MKTPRLFTLRHTVIFIIVALIVIVVLIRIRSVFRQPIKTENSALLLPDLEKKPVPREITFRGCPPEGSGGDGDLNLLKNRVDEGVYENVKFSVMAGLRWPAGAERHKRAEWPEDVRAAIAADEGDPIMVEGYLLRVKEEGPESPNCHSGEHEMRDFHIWLASSPDDGEDRAAIVEITPRIRANHPFWTVQRVREIARDRLPVRICGWLLFDQEHPEQIGKTRATLWEIHPVMKIEFQHDGEWTSLDRDHG